MEILTVIIPVFNSKKLFWETYKSIIQTDKLKIIIIEKKSEELIEKARLKTNTDYYLQETNGQYLAIEEGFMKAKSRYITWLNTGDLSLISEELLVDLSKVLNKSIIVFNRSWYDENGFLFSKRNVINKNDVVNGLYDGVNRNLIPAESILFSKELYEQTIAFKKYHFAADYHLWIELFRKCDYVVRLDYYLFSFLLHHGRSKIYKNEYFDEIGSKAKNKIIKLILSRLFKQARYHKVDGSHKSKSYELDIFNPSLRLRKLCRNINLIRKTEFLKKI